MEIKQPKIIEEAICTVANTTYNEGEKAKHKQKHKHNNGNANQSNNNNQHQLKHTKRNQCGQQQNSTEGTKTAAATPKHALPGKGKGKKQNANQNSNQPNEIST